MTMSYMRLRRLVGKRSRCLRLIVFISVFVIGYLVSMVLVANKMTADTGFSWYTTDHNFIHRTLLATNATTKQKSNYPEDIFSLQQRRSGAVLLHVIGMIYMFVALAIVCDEFFVPSLEIIIERLEISEDVAGATFMAAGGSAPELFTSIIGVFISRTDVGIGTIVGSAVFNILFVIGMCAVFSKNLLKLTWWPLFRDVTFYSIDLILLIVFFADDLIQWWESLILFSCYFCYVIFMKYNHNIENVIKSLMKRNAKNKVANTDALVNRICDRRCSQPILHAGGCRYRHGVLQIMIHTLDPLGEGHDAEKAIQLHALASKPPSKKEDDDTSKQNGFQGTSPVNIQVISNGKVESPAEDSRGSPAYSEKTQDTLVDHRAGTARSEQNGETPRQDNEPSGSQPPDADALSNGSDERPDLEEEEEPLDLSWPDSTKKRITYILVAPIMFTLWVTLPDVRVPEKKKWYGVTFVGSITWIALFSYLMVWWANQTGETVGITPEIMGLTVLAAGTSIPDLITSVIVAKKGYGDMAVSSSVGSNIFDITVGLPLPWMIFSGIYSGMPYSVTSRGLLCSIILLFLMLLILILTIALSKWQLSRRLGGCMFIFYFVFVTLSVLLEFEIIKCPQM